MRHGIAHRKLGRNPGHRKALLRNMMNALVRSERIETTVAKAKEVRILADRLITLGKKDNTHARRRAFSLLSDKGNTEKVFATLATRFAGREGGYTRIVRTGYRAGDGSEMAIRCDGRDVYDGAGRRRQGEDGGRCRSRRQVPEEGETGGRKENLFSPGSERATRRRERETRQKESEEERGRIGRPGRKMPGTGNRNERPAWAAFIFISPRRRG